MAQIKPVVELYCSKCGTELFIPYQLGKKKKDRKLYCGKCAKEVRNAK